MRRLSKDEVVMLHRKLIDVTGGLDGILDFGMIESSLEQIWAAFDDEDLYPAIEDKAARLCFAFIRNHAFVDGNKRIGIFVMLVFLELNDIKLKFTQQELVSLGLDVADGSMDYPDIVEWISNH